MKIYRVELRTEAEGSKGFEYFPSEVKAKARMKQWNTDEEGGKATFTPLDIASGIPGMIAALTTYGGHPDNG